MESFTHEEFIRALGMEGKTPFLADDDKAVQRYAEERDAQVQALLAKRAAAKRGGSVVDADDVEFTHDMFVEAMKMQGKELPVTSEGLEALEARRLAELERMQQVRYKKRDRKSLAEQWEEDRHHEADEAEQEATQRRQAKEAAAAAARAEGAAEADSSADAATITAEQRVESGTPNRLFEGVGHRDARNHVLAVRIQSPLVDEVRDSGIAVTLAATLDDARDILTSHLAQPTAQNINLSVVVHVSPDDTGSTAIQDFVEYAQRTLFPTPAASQPPPVVLYAKPAEADTVLPPEFLCYLRTQLRPPYVVCSVCDTTVKKFIVNNKSDTSLEEEVATLNALVSTKLKQASEANAGAAPTRGVIATGKDVDLSLSNAQQVQWIEVAMNWKGRMDLDLSCILLNREGGRAGMVYFANVATHKSSGFSHSGDIQTAPNGDKECIVVALPRVPPTVHCMYYVINSFSGEPFSDVEAIDAAITLSDEEAGNGLREVCTQFPLTGSGEHRAVVLCRVYRTGKASWGITKVDITHDKAATCRELVGTVKKNYQEQPPLVWEDTEL